MRGMQMVGCPLLVAGCLLLATESTFAQTNDVLYSQRDWIELTGSPRAIGLGGAFVAVADDYSAAVLNPAGLGIMPKNEIGGALAGFSQRKAGVNALESSTGLGLVGGNARITSKWSLGGFVDRPVVARRSLTRTFADRAGTGWLNETVTLGGVAGAWTPNPRLHVGMSLLMADLRTQGLYEETGAEAMTVGIAGGSRRVLSSVGALLSVGSARFGLVARTGGTWSDVERRAHSGGAETTQTFPVRIPSLVCAGVALQASPRLLVSVQGDYVRYSEIRTILAVRRGVAAREDYTLKDKLEFRAGAEASFPLGDVSLQLRGGVQARGAALLTYGGRQAYDQVAFTPGDDTMTGHGGVSFVTRSGWRLEVAMRAGGQRAVVGGASVRF